jgi:hypothetical protein
MAVYVAQAIALGFLLWCVTLSSHRNDLFVGAYVCVWTIGVIFLYWKYGTAQDVFYSNDQAIQVQLVEQTEIHGIDFSLEGLIGNRYIVTIPALLLSRCGINSLLAFKFLQAIFFLLTYRLVLNHFAKENLKFKTWYIVLFSGPIFVFMSLLGLRDLALAYFSLYIVIGRTTGFRAISWLSAFLLRPHLAIALAFGRLIGFAYRRARSNLHLILLPIVLVFSFVCGIYSFGIGSYFQWGTNLDLPSVGHPFTQGIFTQLFANFGGLQFLLHGPGIVKFSILSLLLLRIVFFDTFLIPSIFVWTVITSSKLRIRSISIYSAFAFFLGLVLQTEYNSSRQNIPFLVLMGVTVAEHLALRQRDDTNKRGQVSVAALDLDQSPTRR